MWKCPKCKEEVTQLYYNVNVTGNDNGTASLKENPEEEETINPDRDIVTDYECDNSDSDWEDSPEYECPECNCHILLKNLIWEKETDETPKVEEENEEESHKIITPQNQIICKEQGQKSAIGTSMICKECRHILVYDNEDDYCLNPEELFCECPKCNTINSSIEFKELLDKGFFDKPIIIKKHDTIKTKNRLISSLARKPRMLHNKILGSAGRKKTVSS